MTEAFTNRYRRLSQAMLENENERALITKKRRRLAAARSKDPQATLPAPDGVSEPITQEQLRKMGDANARQADQLQKELVKLAYDYVAYWQPQQMAASYAQVLEKLCSIELQAQVDEALWELHGCRTQTVVQWFNRFLEGHGQVFVKRLRSFRRKQKALTSDFMKRFWSAEGVPSDLYHVFKVKQNLMNALTNNAEQACLIVYTKAAAAFDVKDMRDAMGRHTQLKKAFNATVKDFDFTRRAQQTMLDYIPEDFTQLYPAARTLDRHFILHVGPTNSGKSHDAVAALAAAQNGIYLAPLRLLAFEQFDSMNKDGVYCSLRTGEERIEVPGATVQSSTIEMLDTTEFYDVAVIDEAQMIQDPVRGGNWTRAILGTLAREIHVCLAPHAEEIVIRLIEQCRDTYEVIRHERFNPLNPDRNARISFPDNILPGDACIVFSRASAHACAAELQRKGVKTSIIYGALPYDVRQNEARRFREGETDVVVATDAIGMGLNLPIRRVVFLETEKFDGISKRPLTPSEYQQIAGRAGRYGQFEEGLYISQYRMRNIIEAVNQSIPPIRFAHLLFPEILLGVDAPLSKILEMWNNLPASDCYKKGQVDQEIRLAKELEALTKDKELIFKLISLPIDDSREAVHDLWLRLSKVCIRGGRIRPDDFIPDIQELLQSDSLATLEASYRLYDLLYNYAERFEPEHINRIADEKLMLSRRLMDLLSTTKLEVRRCKHCGREIPWNSGYGTCFECGGMGVRYNPR